MYALESALDELAVACGLDPVELRIRNEPEIDPETGQRFSSRNLVACLREGAERFGWSGRDPRPGAAGRAAGLSAAASPPRPIRPAGAVRRPAIARHRGGYTVEIAAADIGTGARTALDSDRRRRARGPARSGEVADRRYRAARGDDRRRFDGNRVVGFGGGQGVPGVASALIAARRRGAGRGLADTAEEIDGRSRRWPGTPSARSSSRRRVNIDTGEVRVRRALGVFAAGRIINPRRRARSSSVG